MNARLRKKLSKRPRQIGRCRGCKGRIVLLTAPLVGFVEHRKGCRLLNDADYGYHAALLGRFFNAAKVVGD